MHKAFDKNLLFLSFLIFFGSFATFADFFDLRPWPIKIYGWFKSREKTKAKQEGMINQLHNEYEKSFDQFQEVYGINNDVWQEILKKRAQEKEEFLKLLEKPREDHFHDPGLSCGDKLLFKYACYLQGVNSYAVDIRFDNNIEAAAEARIISNHPTILLNQKKWDLWFNKLNIFVHEIEHFKEGHVIDRNVLVNLVFPQQSIVNKMFLGMSEFFTGRPSKIILQWQQHREADAEILRDCSSRFYNLTIKIVREEQKKLVEKNILEAIEDHEHLNFFEQLYLRRLIYHRIWAQDHEKTIEDIIKYDKRCNEAPLIQSTFGKRNQVT